MSRTQTVAAGVVALLLAAFGLMVWVNVFGLQQRLGLKPSEGELMAELGSIASSGGYVGTFSASGLKLWSVAEGHMLERFGLNDTGAAFGRVKSSVPIDKKRFDWRNLGVSWLVPQTFNNSSKGQRVEIGVVARYSSSASADDLKLVYATQQAGATGWKSIPLSSEFELQKVIYDVPTIEGNFVNPAIITLNADLSGAGKSVEVLGVYVRLLPPS